MYKLTQEQGTAIILITHNLGIVAESAKRIVVMYAGKIVEEGPVEAIFQAARHPYTQGLLRCVPVPRKHRDGDYEPLYEIEGIVPSLSELPKGCAFHPRCSFAKDICNQQEPDWVEVDPGHYVACWLYN
jgi:oligopeptide/dipeptide ABC transporter ATP-binding protein